MLRGRARQLRQLRQPQTEDMLQLYVGRQWNQASAIQQSNAQRCSECVRMLVPCTQSGRRQSSTALSPMRSTWRLRR